MGYRLCAGRFRDPRIVPPYKSTPISPSVAIMYDLSSMRSNLMVGPTQVNQDEISSGLLSISEKL